MFPYFTAKPGELNMNFLNTDKKDRRFEQNDTYPSTKKQRQENQEFKVIIDQREILYQKTKTKKQNTKQKTNSM